LLVISGETLHPRPQVTNCQGADASTQVGREGINSVVQEDHFDTHTLSAFADAGC
jgi:hypothetical protein